MTYDEHQCKFDAYRKQDPPQPVQFLIVLFFMLIPVVVLGIALAVMYLMKGI